MSRAPSCANKARTAGDTAIPEVGRRATAIYGGLTESGVGWPSVTGQFLSFARSSADARYDRSRGGADIARRHARHAGISQAAFRNASVLTATECGTRVSFSP